MGRSLLLAEQKMIMAEDTWGDAMEYKKPSTIRILLQNIGGVDIHQGRSINSWQYMIL